MAPRSICNQAIHCQTAPSVLAKPNFSSSSNCRDTALMASASPYLMHKSRLQCFQEHTPHRDGTARSAHRVETSTSHIRDASLGDEMGSRALQDAVVHSGDFSNRYDPDLRRISSILYDVNFTWCAIHFVNRLGRASEYVCRCCIVSSYLWQQHY
jgi:hypothetical protein